MSDTYPGRSEFSAEEEKAMRERRLSPAEEDVSYSGEIGRHLERAGFPLPTENDPLSENVIDRTAPIFTRAMYPTGRRSVHLLADGRRSLKDLLRDQQPPPPKPGDLF